MVNSEENLETESEFMSRLDRDSLYRVHALYNAVKRGGQDGGLEGKPIDVLRLADVYYNWLRGDEEITEGPIIEELKQEQSS